MRMRTFQCLLVHLIGVLAAGTALAQADYGQGAEAQTQTRGTVLSMPRSAQPGHDERSDTARYDTPPRGMSMRRVLREYGQPLTRHAAVGDPPITRWDYPDYHLYFEYDHVLHAVRPDAPVPVTHTDELSRATQ